MPAELRQQDQAYMCPVHIRSKKNSCGKQTVEKSADSTCLSHAKYLPLLYSTTVARVREDAVHTTSCYSLENDLVELNQWGVVKSIYHQESIRVMVELGIGPCPALMSNQVITAYVLQQRQTINSICLHIGKSIAAKLVERAQMIFLISEKWKGEMKTKK